jgi:hypothetical protein
MESKMEVLENFLKYNIRHHILLAQYVANTHKSKVYIFDTVEFFKNEVTVELTGGIKTLSKDGDKAVLNIAINEAFKTNENLFLQYVDPDILQKDNIGLYLSPASPDASSPLIEEVEEEEPMPREEVF